MAFLRSLSPNAALFEVFQRFPATARPLLEYHETLLRGESPLSVAERELIAAFVSGINACNYCHGIHTATAEAFGIEPDLLAALVEDVDAAPVAEKLKPILRYARKLTLTPSRMTPADAEAVFAVGWDDDALHDAVSVCALFNFMNRLVEGLGIEPPEGYHQRSAQRLHEVGYAGLLAKVEASGAEDEAQAEP